MQAVILSAGEGTRLRPLTGNIAKVMVPIHGKPLLEWHIEYLRSYNIQEIFINLHYLPETVINYFGDGSKFGVRITYSSEEELLGTAGGLRKFANLIDQHVLVLYGDIFTQINLDKFLDFHLRKKSDCTIVVHPTDHPEDSDLISFSKDQRVIDFHFKPHAKTFDSVYGISAIYIFNPKVFGLLPDKVPSDLARDFLPILLKHNYNLFCYNTDELAMDIGTVDRYNKVISMIKP